MERKQSFFRRIARGLGPALTVLMLGVVVIGSSHHHGTLDGHRPCAVCTAASAPAEAANAVPTLSASLALARPIVSPRIEPRVRLPIHGISSRAPPAA